MAKVPHAEFPNLLSLSLREAYEAFNFATRHVKRFLASDYKIPEDFMRPGEDLRFRVRKFGHAEHAEEPEGQLLYLISQGEEFAQLFREAEASISSPFIVERNARPGLEQLLELARAEAFEFTEFTKSLTMTHVTLEEHFVSFCRGYSTGHSRGSEELLSPLAKLRDDYFRSPKVRTLEVYVAMAEAIAADYDPAEEDSHKSESARSYHRNAREEAAKQLINLEVTIMVYELEKS